MPQVQLQDFFRGHFTEKRVRGSRRFVGQAVDGGFQLPQALFGRNIRVGKQRVARARQFETRLHRLGGGDPFQGLDPSHLIDTDRVGALFLEQARGFQVAGADRLDLLLERLGVIRLGIEPVPAAMRLECGRILKNARRGGQKSTPRCRVVGPRRPAPVASSGSRGGRCLRAARRPRR